MKQNTGNDSGVNVAELSLYQSVLLHLPYCLAIVNNTGKILFVNNAWIGFASSLRSDEHEWNAKGTAYLPLYCEILRTDVEVENMLEKGLRSVAEGKETSFEYEFCVAALPGRRLSFKAEKLNADDDYLLCYHNEVTESYTNSRKKEENETEKTKLLDDLTKKYNELMQFNYIVSHNLRAPIANMIGLCEIIGLEGISQAEKDNILLDIHKVIFKMDELVKDLNVILSLSSPLNDKKVPCSVRNIIYGITHTLEKQIKESRTVINTDIADDAARIITIKSYLESILYNLISNAIKYKAPERAPKIDVKVWQKNADWFISITDNGIGINLDKNRNYLFGLYKRFNFDVGGKGLGLHMTKTQVEALGGDISVESTLNKGTTFTIQLPII